MKRSNPLRMQSGASLIEVLVAVLILSFGLLALGAMLAYSVQMPKLAAYRANASMLAASHVERMRANPAGFDGTTNLDGNYIETMTYKVATLPTVTPCVYPACDAATLATLDKDATNRAIRASLPPFDGSGMRVTCNGICSNREGDLWIIWQEPNTFAAFNPANSDECPANVAPVFTAFTAPMPRCLHIRFKL
jgi:type IV pilus assembly protein PilV